MITIKDTTATATSKEGITRSMPLDQWVTKVTNHQEPDILPDGVKCVLHKGGHLMMIHQQPPALRSLKWIHPDSPIKFGKGTKYRDITLALPYVITFAVFEPYGNGRCLAKWNECFFSQRPLSSLNDHVCYPGLLNCSKFPPGDREDAAWICTQHLDYDSLQMESNNDKRTRKGLSALIRCLFDTGFNYSSEEHEGNSWYTATKDLDPRITTAELWAKESKKNPLFVLDVPWIPAALTIRDIAKKVFERNGAVAENKASLTVLEKIINTHT